MPFTLITWNVNGIRSVDIKSELQNLSTDILCIQETKLTRDKIDSDFACVDGWNAYFSFYKGRGGYSGVATYCRDGVATPIACSEALISPANTELFGSNIEQFSASGFTLPPSPCHSGEDPDPGGTDELGKHHWFANSSVDKLDEEGRCVMTIHQLCNEETLAVVNVYCPRNDPDRPERLEYKRAFHDVLAQRVLLLKNLGHRVVLTGDLNVAHRRVDHCEQHLQPDFEEYEFRRWLDWLFGEPGMIDAFRHFFPDRKVAYTCWDMRTNARSINYGSRIDYIITCESAKNLLESCDLLTEHYGSDHCPVRATFRCAVNPAQRPPLGCVRYLPEIRGSQVSLGKYFQKTAATSVVWNVNASRKTTANKKRIAPYSLDAFVVRTKKKVTENVSEDGSQSESTFSGTCFDSGAKENLNQTTTDEDSRAATERSKPAPWNSLFSNNQKLVIPKCSIHNLPCVLRVVKKDGPNKGRTFYCCRLPENVEPGQPARCDFFKWTK